MTNWTLAAHTYRPLESSSESEGQLRPMWPTDSKNTFDSELLLHIEQCLETIERLKCDFNRIRKTIVHQSSPEDTEMDVE